jgi:hypothetical protein
MVLKIIPNKDHVEILVSPPLYLIETYQPDPLEVHGTEVSNQKAWTGRLTDQKPSSQSDLN